MSCILRFPEFRFKALTLSYDDGNALDNKIIDIIDKNGIKATFNLCSSMIGGGNMVSENDVKERMLGHGHEVAVHGERHLSLASISGGVAIRDVVRCKEDLEKMCGRIISGMAYANGSCNDDIVNMLRLAGIHYARLTRPTENFEIPKDWLRLYPTCHHNHPRLMELAHKFIEEPLRDYYWARQPRLFYLWGHSHEFPRDNNWNVLTEFCEYMGNRDDVWYATNGEIYDYCQAYSRLEFSIDGTLIYNPTLIPIYVYDFGKNILIHPGETVDTKTL